MDFPSARFFSRTYTGHPHTCSESSFCIGNLVFDHKSIGDSPVLTLGIRLWMYTACLTARGHVVGSAATSGQCVAACRSIVLAMAMMVLMARSALPFWWWLPAPEYMASCPCSSRRALNSLLVNALPLSDWYSWMMIPLSYAIFSKLLIASRV